MEDKKESVISMEQRQKIWKLFQEKARQEISIHILKYSPREDMISLQKSLKTAK